MPQKSRWFFGLILLPTLFFAFENPNVVSQKKQETEQKSASVDAATPVVSASDIYNELHLAEKGLAKTTFENAWKGYCKLSSARLLKKDLLSIVDMSQPSCQKRLYIIDMAARKLLVHTLVAHGRNSGETMATHFSNTNSSLQSSLGFYITGNTYEGNNGYSMRLRGLEKGFNDQAETRAIVMHGAPYVNEDLARKTGRIGRSWGCPAVSEKEHKAIIDLVKNGSCLFVFAPEKKYLAQSAFAGNVTASL